MFGTGLRHTHKHTHIHTHTDSSTFLGSSWASTADNSSSLPLLLNGSIFICHKANLLNPHSTFNGYFDIAVGRRRHLSLFWLVLVYNKPQIWFQSHLDTHPNCPTSSANLSGTFSCSGRWVDSFEVGSQNILLSCVCQWKPFTCKSSNSCYSTETLLTYCVTLCYC